MALGRGWTLPELTQAVRGRAEGWDFRFKDGVEWTARRSVALLEQCLVTVSVIFLKDAYFLTCVNIAINGYKKYQNTVLCFRLEKSMQK